MPGDKGVPVEVSMGLDPEADTPERAWALLASGHFLTSPGMFRALHLLHVCQTPMAGHHTPLWAARSWAERWGLLGPAHP